MIVIITKFRSRKERKRMKRKQNEVAQVAQALKNVFEGISFFFSFKTKELDSHL